MNVKSNLKAGQSSVAILDNNGRQERTAGTEPQQLLPNT